MGTILSFEIRTPATPPIVILKARAKKRKGDIGRDFIDRLVVDKARRRRMAQHRCRVTLTVFNPVGHSATKMSFGSIPHFVPTGRRL